MQQTARFIEKMNAPYFQLDWTLMAPDEDDRNDRIRLLAMAEACLKHDPEMAMRLRAEADSLLKPRWEEQTRNLVTTEGKNDVLDKYFKGSSYTAAWYLALKGTGGALAADTLASHGSWSEVSPYSGNRPAITFGSSSAGSNTATQISFSITSGATVAGAFIASVNSGTSGKLYSATDFSSSRTVANSDTLNVTPTVVAA